MRTLLKILLALAGVAVVLFVALVVAVTLIFEPDDYRGYIVQAVEDATGRSFELAGELSLDVFPCCAVALGPARLGNPEDFPEQQFASFRAASLSLKLWPLIARREVVVGTVTLDGVDVALVRLADGRVNWEIEGEAAADTPQVESEPILAGLKVESVRLTETRVRYVDQESGVAYTVSDLALTTGAIDYGTGGVTSFPLEAELTFLDESDGTSAEVRIETALALEGDRLTARGPTITIAAAGSQVPGGEAGLDASAELLVVGLGEETVVDIAGAEAIVRLLDAEMTLNAQGRADVEGGLTGTFALTELSPRRLLEAVAGDGYRPADAAAMTRLAARAQWSLQRSTVAVDELEVRLDDTRLTGTAAAEGFGADGVRFDLAMDAVDVDRYQPAEDGLEGAAGGNRAQGATSVGSERASVAPTGAADAASAVELPPLDGRVRIGTLVVSGIPIDDVDLRLQGDGQAVQVRLAARALEGRLTAQGRGTPLGDGARITGSLEVDGMSPRRLLEALDTALETADPVVLADLSGRAAWAVTPTSAALDDMRWRLDDTELTGSLGIDDFDTLAARFDLAVDRLNVDRYLAPETEGAADEEAVAEIPVELIRGLDLDGRLRAGELVLLNMTWRDVIAEVSAADGVLRLDPLTAGLYGGRYAGTVTIDATGAEANLAVAQKLAAVQVGEILQSYFGSDALTGSLSLELDGSGAGNTPEDLLRGLAGSVSFDLSDGVYRGLDVIQELRRARALLKNEAAPEDPDARETSIRALTASGRMEHGVLQTNRLKANASGLELAGRGGINLLELALDYELDAQFTEAAAKAAGLSDLAGLTIPLAISGPLSSPSVGVDLKQLITTSLRSTVEQRARETLLDRLGGSAEPAPDATPQPAESEEPPKEPSARDLLKRGLRDLLKPQPKDE